MRCEDKRPKLQGKNDAAVAIVYSGLKLERPMKSLRWCAPLLILCLASSSLWAKGPTTRIVITAPSLPGPVEISDTELLRGFAVWSGPGVQVNGQPQSHGFIIDWPAGVVARRPAGLARYEVSFYVRRANRSLAVSPEHLAYVVSYEPDPSGGGGYVYLPGRGDAHYGLNTRTIFRGHEGHWFRASEAWNQAAMRVIGERR
jgi:hypothetical protein